MTDFLQILQREMDPVSIKNEMADKKNNGDVSAAKKTNTDPVEKKPGKKPNEKIKSPTQSKDATSAKPKTKKESKEKILSYEVLNPIWLTMSEAAKMGGVQKKTIKRAISSKVLKYRIVDNRYQVDLRSVILHMADKKKLCNKLKEHGLGQYVEKWRE